MYATEQHVKNIHFSNRFRSNIRSGRVTRCVIRAQLKVDTVQQNVSCYWLKILCNTWTTLNDSQYQRWHGKFASEKFYSPQNKTCKCQKSLWRIASTVCTALWNLERCNLGFEQQRLKKGTKSTQNTCHVWLSHTTNEFLTQWRTHKRGNFFDRFNIFVLPPSQGMCHMLIF